MHWLKYWVMLGLTTAIVECIILVHISTAKTWGKNAWQTNTSSKFCGANNWRAGSLAPNQSMPRKYIWTSFPAGQYNIFWAIAPISTFYWYPPLFEEPQKASSWTVRMRMTYKSAALWTWHAPGGQETSEWFRKHDVLSSTWKPNPKM